MYPVSDEFLDAVKKSTRSYYWNGTITTVSGTEYTFGNRDILKGSAYINQKCCGDSEIEIGASYAGELKMTLFNNIDRYTLTDAEVKIYYNLVLSDGSTETVPMGVFIVSEANRSIKTLEITAYDGMVKLDKDFSDTLMEGTAYEILSLMATACNVELAQTQEEIEAMINGTESFSIYEENDIETWRDVLYFVAQALGCFATFNRYGKLELRKYTMTPVFTIDSKHRFDSTFSDFKTRYTAVSSTNARTQIAEYYALETDDGLTMNLETNPLLQYGLASIRERILTNILNQISEIEYVPFDSSTIGNPALDVGDVIMQTGGHADEDSYYCITEIECKVNGKQTIRGVGRNPRLASAKSKNDKNIAGLMEQTETGKVVYYNFVNASAYKITTTLTRIISIDYVSTEATTALFLAQAILEVTPEEDGGTVVVKVTYKKGLDEETTFYPIDTYETGTHLLSLFYPITSIEENKSNQFNVYLSATGGSVEIGAGNVRASISGQGLASGIIDWDGNIEVKEVFGEAFTWDVESAFTVDTFYGTVNVKINEPAASTVSDSFEDITMAIPEFSVVSLDENLNAGAVITSFTVDSTYQPSFSTEYVICADDVFQLVTGYESDDCTEETVNYGKMSVLRVNTEEFESVTEMEVIRC